MLVLDEKNPVKIDMDKLAIWNCVTEAKKTEPMMRKMNLGLFCFKVMYIQPAKKIVNEYDRIFEKDKEKYLNSIKKNKNSVSKYEMCELGVKVRHWSSVLKIDQGIKFEGMNMKTHVTLPILQHIRSNLDKFIEWKKPEPELILYWKPNKITVKYTFIYEKDWNKYKAMILSADTDTLKDTFYWLGRKEGFDEDKFMEWYE